MRIDLTYFDAIFKKLMIFVTEIQSYFTTIYLSKCKQKEKQIVNKEIRKRETEEEDDELNLYISLADGNIFPSWFTKWKDGFIRLPFNKRKIMTTSNHLVTLNTDDKIMVFDCNNEFFAQDDNYICTLSEIIITPQITKHDVFLMVIVINFIVKPSQKKVITDYCHQRAFEYEILCPIWQ